MPDQTPTHSVLAVDVDLFVEVVEALQAIAIELDNIGEMEVDLPERVVDRLNQGAALLKAVEALDDDAKTTLREAYTKALESQQDVYMSGGSPHVLIPEAYTEISERLRRAALTDPAVDVAVKRAVVHW